MAKVNRWLNNIQFCLFPGTCVICDTASYRQLDLCLDCEANLPRPASPCLCCGLPLRTGSYKGDICGRCINKTPPYTRIISAFNYAEPVNSLISAFKYADKLAYGRVLSELLLQKLEVVYQHRPLPDLLIPMPLHAKRVRERGYNQALEIARILGRNLDIPIDYQNFTRNRYTSPQEGLNIQQRRSNLHRAFTCRNNSISLPACVAIVDDVITTTASIQSLCKILRKYGAEEIYAWSLARALRKV